jgi:hypothetical protein
VDDRPVIQLDILPTALAAAGVEVQSDWKMEGVNLLPYLSGEKKETPHEALYWRFGQQLAIRRGDWKLVKGAGAGVNRSGANVSATTQGAHLFNLASDPGEKTDLAEKEPQTVESLAAAWNRWNAGNIAPKWLPRRRNAAANVADAAPAKGPWKSGDAIRGKEAPAVAGHGFTIAAEIDGSAPNGVIVAQGGKANGYALFVHEGKLAFAMRLDGKLSVVTAANALDAGVRRVGAKLDADGKLTLTVGEQVVGEGKLSGILGSQPQEGLTIGNDGRGAVGEYEAPNAFTGKVTNATVTILQGN